MHSKRVFAVLVLGLTAWTLAAPGLAQPLGATARVPDGGDPPVPPGEPEPACEDGVVKDDGTVETGYGWVPSVIDGRYVQEFFAGEFPSRNLESVCVCWLQTDGDTEIDYEVVFYESVLDDFGEPRPADEPYHVVAATATDVPEGITGAFYEVDVSGIRIPLGRNYIGVRWDAMVDQFFFVCADNTEETEPVEVFFIDDRASGWTSVFDTLDPIFDKHRAMMVRVTANPLAGVEIPSLNAVGLGILALLLAGLGLGRLRQRR